MIVVNLVKTNGLFTGFDIQGHAGYADYGKDIVCAAISTISQAVWSELCKLDEVTETEYDSGYLKVNILGANPISQVLMDMLLDTATSISEQYPNNVEVIIK